MAGDGRRALGPGRARGPGLGCIFKLAGWARTPHTPGSILAGWAVEDEEVQMERALEDGQMQWLAETSSWVQLISYKFE